MSKGFDPIAFTSRLVAAHRTHQPLSAEDFGDGPQTLDDAYAVQTGVMAELGPVGGFKTSRPNPVRPNIMAPIPAANVRPSPAHYARDEMRLVGIELEIAFRLDDALPDRAAADYDAKLRNAVSVMPVIEMVDSRYEDLGVVSDIQKLADNQSGFGLVIGDAISDFSALNLTNPEITFTVNGAQIGTTSGQVPGGVDAFQVLKDFLEVIGDHCGGIERGMYLTTGSLSGLHWAKHGDVIEGHVAGLGTVMSTVSG